MVFGRLGRSAPLAERVRVEFLHGYEVLVVDLEGLGLLELLGLLRGRGRLVLRCGKEDAHFGVAVAEGVARGSVARPRVTPVLLFGVRFSLLLKCFDGFLVRV